MASEPVLETAKPRKHFKMVDFPQPDGPVMRTFCPVGTSSEKPSSTVLPSKAKDRFSACNAMSSELAIMVRIAGNRLPVKSSGVIRSGLQPDNGGN